MVSKVIRFATEKILSVENELLAYQFGKVASPVNSTASYIPCEITKPVTVTLTPVKSGSVSANNLITYAEVESLTDLSGVSDLPAWAASTQYYEGQVVSNGGKAYICHTTHTSGATFNPANWTKLSATTFIKLNHPSPGAGKVFNFNFFIVGYDV